MNNRPSKTAVYECTGAYTCHGPSHLVGCPAYKASSDDILPIVNFSGGLPIVGSMPVVDPASDIHDEGRALVQQIHGLHAIRTRLEEDRAEYASTAGDQSIRDRDHLLKIIQEQALKLGAVQMLLERARIHGNAIVFASEVSYAIGNK